MAGNGKKDAPPFGDKGTTSGTARAMQSHAKAFVSRLGKLDTFRAPGDTGSSGRMPSATSRGDTVKRLGGNSGPKSFTPIKT